jgi:hypothetical protein
VLLEQQKQDAGTKITGLNEALALARGELSLAKCRADELSKKVQVFKTAVVWFEVGRSDVSLCNFVHKYA